MKSMMLAGPAPPGLKSRAVVLASLFVGVLAWLWPIGIGGKMPVGGDVTHFFLGLMGVLSQCAA